MSDTVVITNPEPVVEPVVEPPTPVIVVEAPEVDTHAAEELGRLRAENEEFKRRLEVLEETPPVVVVEPPPVVEPVVEEPEVEHHDDPPNNKHPFFKSKDELMGH